MSGQTEDREATPPPETVVASEVVDESGSEDSSEDSASSTGTGSNSGSSSGGSSSGSSRTSSGSNASAASTHKGASADGGQSADDSQINDEQPEEYDQALSEHDNDVESVVDDLLDESESVLAPAVFATPCAKLGTSANSTSPNGSVVVVSSSKTSEPVSPHIDTPAKDVVAPILASPAVLVASSVRKALATNDVTSKGSKSMSSSTTPKVESSKASVVSKVSKVSTTTKRNAGAANNVSVIQKEVAETSSSVVKDRKKPRSDKSKTEKKSDKQPVAESKTVTEVKESRKHHDKSSSNDAPTTSAMAETPAKKRRVEPAAAADKKRNKKKKSKSKSRKSESRKSRKSTHKDQSSDSQSSSDGSALKVQSSSTSARIKRISDGRRYQKMAMSRSKRLGWIVDGNIQLTRITDALKKIDSVEFKVLPTHAYRRYHRVPGTHLPHSLRHLGNLLKRYGELVKKVAKLCLILARDQIYAKRSLIGPEESNEFVTIWQFENDLQRAQAASSSSILPIASTSSGTMDMGNSSVIEVDFKDLKGIKATPVKALAAGSHNDIGTASGSRDGGTSDKSSRKHSRKRKHRNHDSE